MLLRYSDFLKELAEKEKLTLADLNTSVVAALDKAKAAKPNSPRASWRTAFIPDPAGTL